MRRDANVHSSARMRQAASLAPLARVLGWHAELFRIVRLTAWPLFDIALRLGLAREFFVSGVIKASNWSNALYLAREVYPVSWLSPVAAAYTIRTGEKDVVN